MNERQIRSLKYTGKTQQYSLGGGLYIRVKKTKKVFIVRKTVNGRAYVITLGDTPGLSLKDARYKAARLKIKQEISSITIKELKAAYWAEVVIPNSKVPDKVLVYLKNIESGLGSRKVNDLTKLTLVRFVKQYSKDHGSRSGDMMLSYLKGLLSYAVEEGWIDGSPLREVTTRITGYRYKKRERVLTDNEIRMVWQWKSKDKGIDRTDENVRMIKFLLLTGLRIAEARNGYVEGDKFKIDDTKGRHHKDETRPHWVYLTETASDQLPLPACTVTNFQSWLKRKLVNEGYTDDRFTPHDCRRTYATRANDAKVDPYIVERVLNHTLQGMQAIYNQSEFEQERINCALAVEKEILKILEKPDS